MIKTTKYTTVKLVAMSLTYIRHSHNDLDVERYGCRGHDDNQRLASQHREQDTTHSLTHDCVHHADFTI